MRPLIIMILTAFCVQSNVYAAPRDEELALKQNQAYNFATTKWLDRINVSGLLMGEVIASNQDAGSSRRFPDNNKKYSTFCLPRVGLFLDAKLSESTQAHVALNFAPNKMSGTCSACGFGRKNDELRFGKYDKVDEAYVTFGRLIESPYYARAGIQYVPYGYYARNTIPATLPQLMTQTQAAGVTAGYANKDNGVNLAAFSFSGKGKRGGSTKIDNFGGQVGYIKSSEEFDSLVTLGWISNIASAVNYLVSANPTCCGQEQNSLSKGYRKKVQGASLTMQHKASRWDATLQLTSSLSKFNQNDIGWKSNGAKPSAELIEFGYKFNALGDKKNRLGVSYQLSTQAVNIKGNGDGAGLPARRMQVDYTIEVEPHVEFGAHIFWDKDYSKKDGGTGKKSTTMLLTLAVKFG